MKKERKDYAFSLNDASIAGQVKLISKHVEDSMPDATPLGRTRLALKLLTDEVV